MFELTLFDGGLGAFSGPKYVISRTPQQEQEVRGAEEEEANAAVIAMAAHCDVRSRAERRRPIMSAQWKS